MQTKSELREYARRLRSARERADRRWARRMDAFGRSHLEVQAGALVGRIDRRIRMVEAILAGLEELGPYYR
jgi:hypothetical protein